MSKTQTVATDVANAEFDRFCDAMDIDTDTSKMDEDDRNGFEQNKQKIIRAIELGKLVINDDGEPVLTPSRSSKVTNPLTFYEPSGATLMAMDSKKDGKNVSKMFALVDDMTKSAPGTSAKLMGSDYKVALAITVLFLA